MDKYQKDISEQRANVFVGENENFKIKAVTGIKEQPFSIDGSSDAQKIEYTVFTVFPVSYDPLAEYSFEAVIDDVEVSGKLNRHPFEYSYSVTVNRQADEPPTFSVEGETIELKSIKTENFISCEKAFEIALKKLSASITQLRDDGGYEIYIRLIENPISANGGYYWYVAFVSSLDKTISVLIHPETGEIIAIRQ